jgi:putative ABC transport system permease protein
MLEFGPIFRTFFRNKIAVGIMLAEVALTLCIVLNAFVLIRANRQRLAIDTGLDEANLFHVILRSYGSDLADGEVFRRRMEEDLQAINQMAEVHSASSWSPMPLKGGGSSSQRKPEGGDAASLARCPVYGVDQRFLESSGLRLVEGRTFTAEELAPTDNFGQGDRPLTPVIITRAAAETWFAGQSPLNRILTSSDELVREQIVGVVDHFFTPYDLGKSGMEYRSLFSPALAGDADLCHYLVRAKPGRREAAMARIEHLLGELEADRILTLQPLEEIKKTGFFQNQFMMQVLRALVFLLLFTTALGIFGMASSSVAGRTQQIGTRRALGATRSAIVRYFLTETSLLLLGGCLLGGILAFALNYLLVASLPGSILDLATVLFGAFILWLLALLAALGPAWRAASIPPLLATRSV